ncbi:hypothetical protein [Burkholderia multivorans]|nr:hypothetical protein [Burkholderia multivorans]
MNNADKRSVHTDALENAKLDALIAFSFRVKERMAKDRLTA